MKSIVAGNNRTPNVSDLTPDEHGFFILALMYIKLQWHPVSKGKKPSNEPALQNLRIPFNLEYRRMQVIIQRAEYTWDKILRQHLIKRGGVCNVAKAA